MSTIKLRGVITDTKELLVVLPKDIKPGQVNITIELHHEPKASEDSEDPSPQKAIKTGAEVIASGLLNGWKNNRPQ